MKRLMRFDKIIGGMASTARSIFYKPKDTSRAATNVQAELDKINDDVSDINTHFSNLISGTAIIDDIIASASTWADTTFKPSANKLYRIVPNFRGQGSDTTNANVASVIVKGSDLLNTSSACPFVLHGDFGTPTTALGLFYNATSQVVQVYRGAGFFNTFVYHFVVYELS